MTGGIRKSDKGAKTTYLNVGVWYDAKTDRIHLSVPESDWFHTTVAKDPSGKRGHPNLFAKLARALKESGMPHPTIEDGLDDEQA